MNLLPRALCLGFALSAVTCSAAEVSAAMKAAAAGKKVLVVGHSQFIDRHVVLSMIDAGASVEYLGFHQEERTVMEARAPTEEEVEKVARTEPLDVGKAKVLDSVTKHDPKEAEEKTDLQLDWVNNRIPVTICKLTQAARGKCLAKKLRQQSWDMVVDTNVQDLEGIQFIFQYADKVGHYVQLSTDEVYTVCDKSKHTFHESSKKLLEDSSICGHDLRDKVQLEQDFLKQKTGIDIDGRGRALLRKQIDDQLRTSSKVKYTTLRLPHAWGEYENHKLLLMIIQQIELGQRVGLELAGDKPGSSFVFAEDVAQMVLLLLGKGPQQQAMNLASSDSPNFREMVTEVHDVYNEVLYAEYAGSHTLKPLQWDERHDDQMMSTYSHLFLDISKAKEVGFVPTPWKQGWKKAVRAQIEEARRLKDKRENPNGRRSDL